MSTSNFFNKNCIKHCSIYRAVSLCIDLLPLTHKQLELQLSVWSVRWLISSCFHSCSTFSGQWFPSAMIGRFSPFWVIVIWIFLLIRQSRHSQMPVWDPENYDGHSSLFSEVLQAKSRKQSAESTVEIIIGCI